MKIILTGGGTAGHAMVNQVLANILREDEGNQIRYIGSYQGTERALMEGARVTYFPISTGKLRRYFSLENAKDFFRVGKGIIEAYHILKREKANVVFSGGGFVSLPVVVAAGLLKIPILIRETDRTMGLANRICAKFAAKIFTTFPDTPQQIKGLPWVYAGLIIRPELLKKGQPKTQIPSRPVVLVMGGSLGSQVINCTLWDNIGQLGATFQIIHLCGRGQVRSDICGLDYVQQDYASEMADLYAQSDVVVTRCGSNAISEGLALGKRMVCIPISTRVSRGEQLANATYAAENGCAVILEEENLNGESLAKAVKAVLAKPIKETCILSEDGLNENCHLLLHEIQLAATLNLESRKR